VSFDKVPSQKGAAIHIAAFANELRKLGELDLITLDGRLPDDTTPPAPGHHPLRVRGPTPIAQAMHFRAQLAEWWRDRPAVDVVHVRSIFEGYPIARRKTQLCKRFVYEVNGLPSIELKYHYPAVAEDTDLLVKLTTQEDTCLAAADAVMTPSEVTARLLVERGVPRSKIHVIPNGVDTDLFSYQTPRPWAETGEGRGLRWLYSGTLTAWQGILHAIEALRLYRRDAPATLTIVGPAKKRQRRELLDHCASLELTDAVTFLEPVSQEALAALHHQHDVVLAPLLANDRNLVQGCCPLKVIEAMSSGTPLVASDLEVVRSLTGEHAQLVRPGSAKAIKDGVLALATDSYRRAVMSRGARQRVEREFTWRRAQDSLRALYEDLLST